MKHLTLFPILLFVLVACQSASRFNDHRTPASEGVSCKVSFLPNDTLNFESSRRSVAISGAGSPIVEGRLTEDFLALMSKHCSDTYVAKIDRMRVQMGGHFRGRLAFVSNSQLLAEIDLRYATAASYVVFFGLRVPITSIEVRGYDSPSDAARDIEYMTFYGH